MKNLPVVTAQEMARIEEWAVKNGSSQLEFMRRAGLCAAKAALEFTHQHHLKKRALLLAWKGNKGGDAFAAGAKLLEEGFQVKAMLLAPLDQCSELCRFFAAEFEKNGGSIEKFGDFEKEGILIDGLLGTGFSGQVEGVLKEAIDAANGSKLPIVSIDIPSGLNGTTGRVGGVAIRASLTVTMGLPKIGLFLNHGLNFVGELKVGDFGLPKEASERAKPIAFLVQEETVRPLLPPIERCRHKYQAGFVAGYAGSDGYTGAAKLASLSALRGGAGIVKWFYPKEARAECVPSEVIHMPWSEELWREAVQKANAVFLGPGLGQSSARKKEIASILAHLAVPAVFDADALYPQMLLPPVSICTPHRGEMLRLLGATRLEENVLLDQAQAFAKEKKTVLVLKGAPTWIFLPEEVPYIVAGGDPGMATAGSGDVLTGLLAAFLAQGCSAKNSALLGVFLHSLAGELAAKEKTSYSLIAGDLIEFFAKAFSRLLRWQGGILGTSRENG